MDLRKLKTLIDLVAESGISELEVTEENDKVRIVNKVQTVAVAAAPVAAHRRRRFCPWHGKPDAPCLCSAGKSRAQGRRTGRRT